MKPGRGRGSTSLRFATLRVSRSVIATGKSTHSGHAFLIRGSPPEMSGSASDGDPPTRVEAAGAQGVQVGDHGIQVNKFIETYIETQIIQPSFAPLAQPGSSAEVAGWPLDEVTDPFTLEVHRPVQPENLQAELPMLPVYVRREHDLELTRIVRVAARGSSGIAVLVGGSSTGKTRACWEALRLLRDQPKPWRLWHPIDPTRPEAALRELSYISSRTVVWLNEAQYYLGVAADGLGERIAAGLRDLLRSPDRAPVLVLATLWPQHWDALTACIPAGTNPHAHARELLAARDITVPAAFTADQLQQAAETGDPRLATAAKAAGDGQVTQFLAGAPELMARYRNAPPAAAALIAAAMDARRLGMGIALPMAFLEQAVPGYLTDIEWDEVGEDWLQRALAYTAAPCNGIRGPLTHIRPRPGRNAGLALGPTYRLADYLDQHGRRTRSGHVPPTEFWTSAASFADSHDLRGIADAAAARGLLREASQIYVRATMQGDTTAAAALIYLWRSAHCPIEKPAQWVAAHASLDDSAAVADLLEVLQRAGADSAVKVLAGRAAATSSVDAPRLNLLISVLHELGARDEARHLAGRAVTSGVAHDPLAFIDLLHLLPRVGAEEFIPFLLSADPGTHASISDLRNIAERS